MWWKWFPWRFLVRDAARRQGFLDPTKVLTQLQNFAQPSEVAAPMELLRSGVVLHARGLINSLAIQHNLDWIWPYWVECQYNPGNEAFIPRSFSLTQINLTHRNWTALGVPDGVESPVKSLAIGGNSTEAVEFTSTNNFARKYTIRVREAR